MSGLRLEANVVSCVPIMQGAGVAGFIAANTPDVGLLFFIAQLMSPYLHSAPIAPDLLVQLYLQSVLPCVGCDGMKVIRKLGTTITVGNEFRDGNVTSWSMMNPSTPPLAVSNSNTPSSTVVHASIKQVLDTGHSKFSSCESFVPLYHNSKPAACLFAYSKSTEFVKKDESSFSTIAADISRILSRYNGEDSFYTQVDLNSNYLSMFSSPIDGMSLKKSSSNNILRSMSPNIDNPAATPRSILHHGHVRASSINSLLCLNLFSFY